MIIYAPHLQSISEVHGALIEKYGYAPLERVREMVAQSEELRRNLCVAAHLAHVSFAGRQDASGKIVPRYNIVLSSGIASEVCRRVNLGYLNPSDFRRDAYEGDSGTLIVENAGRDLYLVRPGGN